MNKANSKRCFLLSACIGFTIIIALLCSFVCVKNAYGYSYVGSRDYTSHVYMDTQTVGDAKYDIYFPRSEIASDNFYAVYKKPINLTKKKYTVPKSVVCNIPWGRTRLQVVKIAKNAFRECKKLEYISCEAKLESIGNKAFMNCKRLKTFKSKKAVYEIKAKAFYGCTALRTFKAEKYSVNNIGASAFRNCKKLKSFSAMGYRRFAGVTYLSDDYMDYETYSYKEPPEISSKSFYNCKSLQSFSVRVAKSEMGSLYFGDRSFTNCTKLRSLIIKGATKRMSLRLGTYTFYKCKNLRVIKGLKSKETLECFTTTFAKTPLSKKYPGIKLW